MSQVVNQFDWVEFYKEFAEKLLAYKDNRQELIIKVKQIFTDTGIKCLHSKKTTRLSILMLNLIYDNTVS